jgi:hypothetical protein
MAHWKCTKGYITGGLAQLQPTGMCWTKINQRGKYSANPNEQRYRGAL